MPRDKVKVGFRVADEAGDWRYAPVSIRIDGGDAERIQRGHRGRPHLIFVTLNHGSLAGCLDVVTEIATNVVTAMAINATHIAMRRLKLPSGNNVTLLRWKQRRSHWLHRNG